MSDGDDGDDELAVVDFIDGAVVADADAPGVAASELFYNREGGDRLGDIQIYVIELLNYKFSQRSRRPAYLLRSFSPRGSRSKGICLPHYHQ
jgi:hypothetical protein